MLSFLNGAIQNARQMLRKRKRATDEAPALPKDDTTAAAEQNSNRKRQHCVPPEPPPAAAAKVWCCRAHPSCQAGPPSSGEDHEVGCHLARMGSVSLELRAPTALSDLAALPCDVLQSIFQQLLLQVHPTPLARHSCTGMQH
jgi:hypothetical protein